MNEKPISMLMKEFEDQIVGIINTCRLHPSIIELSMRGIYGQVKEVATKQAEFENEQFNTKEQPEIEEKTDNE